MISRFASSPSPSLILNIGSAAHNFVPCATIYGGSKACNEAMSSSLYVEMRADYLHHKVEVLAIYVAKPPKGDGNIE